MAEHDKSTSAELRSSEEQARFAAAGKANDEAAAQRRKFRIALGVAIVAIVVIIILLLRSCAGPVRDPNAALGQLEGKTVEEIQAELDRVIEEGMFNISIANLVEMQDGSSEAELRIENVPGNRYLMQVEITRDDTGEVIYASGIIEPNYHIQSAKLDVDLDAGEYACTAVFNALDPETEDSMGQAAAKMTISVLG